MKIRRIVSTALCLVALCATRPALSGMSDEIKARRARYESMTPEERHAYEHQIVRGKLDTITGRKNMDTVYPSGAQKDAHVRNRMAYNEREQLITDLVNQIPQGFSDFRNGNKKLIDSIVMQLTVLLGWEETDELMKAELVAAALDDEPYFASIMKKAQPEKAQPKKEEPKPKKVEPKKVEPKKVRDLKQKQPKEKFFEAFAKLNQQDKANIKKAIANKTFNLIDKQDARLQPIIGYISSIKHKQQDLDLLLAEINFTYPTLAIEITEHTPSASADLSDAQKAKLEAEVAEQFRNLLNSAPKEDAAAKGDAKADLKADLKMFFATLDTMSPAQKIAIREIILDKLGNKPYPDLTAFHPHIQQILNKYANDEAVLTGLVETIDAKYSNKLFPDATKAPFTYKGESTPIQDEVDFLARIDREKNDIKVAVRAVIYSFLLKKTANFEGLEKIADADPALIGNMMAYLESIKKDKKLVQKIHQRIHVSEQLAAGNAMTAAPSM